MITKRLCAWVRGSGYRFEVYRGEFLDMFLHFPAGLNSLQRRERQVYIDLGRYAVVDNPTGATIDHLIEREKHLDLDLLREVMQAWEFYNQAVSVVEVHVGGKGAGIYAHWQWPNGEEGSAQ